MKKIILSILFLANFLFAGNDLFDDKEALQKLKDYATSVTNSNAKCKEALNYLIDLGTKFDDVGENLYTKIIIKACI